MQSAVLGGGNKYGEISTAGGLKLTLCDMIKIRALYLNNSAWNDQQIISEEWIEKSGNPFDGNHGIKIPGEDLGIVRFDITR